MDLAEDHHQPSIQELSTEADGLHARRRFKEAADLFRRVVEISRKEEGEGKVESRCAALFKLGLALQEQGRYQEAAATYQEAIEAKPDDPACDSLEGAIYTNLGHILSRHARYLDSYKCYKRALQLRTDADLYVNLGRVLKELGCFTEALESFEQALLLNPSHDLAKLGWCIAQLPIVYSTSDDILPSRRRYASALTAVADHFAEESVEIRARASAIVGVDQPFYLAYQGQNDRDLMKVYGEMICSLMAARFPQWSRRPEIRPRRTGERIRVGFVSRYFFTGHSVWKIPLRGFVEGLDRNRFEVFGYYTEKRGDRPAAPAPRDFFTNFVQGPLSVEEWCRAIAADRLDALIYPEFGMDPVSPALGALWLAPVQMVAGGHPVTSGMPTMDYHLSSDLMEPPDGEEHYTERLVRLPNLGVCYTPPNMAPEPISREEVGLGKDDIFFWCCQSLFKLLPEHDDIYPRIAREVGNCKFVFIEDIRGDGKITQTFGARLTEAFRAYGLDAEDYCTSRPHMDGPTFTGMCAAADVFLDSIGWSGCNTAFEAVAQHLPIVTFPGKMMRGRHAMAILRMLGVDETVATTKEEYVQIAVRLAREPEYRRRISQLYAQNKHKLYFDRAPVTALEELLVAELGEKASCGSVSVPEQMTAAVS
jgi:predicted O-linked N-acetylglucosamine transferase (SPINDLY family)